MYSTFRMSGINDMMVNPVSFAECCFSPSYTKLFCNDSTSVHMNITVRVIGTHTTVPHTNVYNETS